MPQPGAAGGCARFPCNCSSLLGQAAAWSKYPNQEQGALFGSLSASASGPKQHGGRICLDLMQMGQELDMVGLEQLY